MVSSTKQSQAQLLLLRQHGGALKYIVALVCVMIGHLLCYQITHTKKQKQKPTVMGTKVVGL